jgi:hypothetical protein
MEPAYAHVVVPEQISAVILGFLPENAATSL